MGKGKKPCLPIYQWCYKFTDNPIWFQLSQQRRDKIGIWDGVLYSDQLGIHDRETYFVNHGCMHVLKIGHIIRSIAEDCSH